LIYILKKIKRWFFLISRIMYLYVRYVLILNKKLVNKTIAKSLNCIKSQSKIFKLN